MGLQDVVDLTCSCGATMHVQSVSPTVVVRRVDAFMEAHARCRDVVQFPMQVYTPNDLYVSPEGDDVNPGTLTEPMKTLTAAVARAKTEGVGVWCYHDPEVERAEVDTVLRRYAQEVWRAFVKYQWSGDLSKPLVAVNDPLPTAVENLGRLLGLEPGRPVEHQLAHSTGWKGEGAWGPGDPGEIGVPAPDAPRCDGTYMHYMDGSVKDGLTHPVLWCAFPPHHAERGSRHSWEPTYRAMVESGVVGNEVEAWTWSAVLARHVKALGENGRGLEAVVLLENEKPPEFPVEVNPRPGPRPAG